MVFLTLPEECEIVWPEDAVLSKEDEITFYERVVVNGVEYKLGDACELWPDEVSLISIF
jgi:hypothetical protein